MFPSPCVLKAIELSSGALLLGRDPPAAPPMSSMTTDSPRSYSDVSMGLESPPRASDDDDAGEAPIPAIPLMPLGVPCRARPVVPTPRALPLGNFGTLWSPMAFENYFDVGLPNADFPFMCAGDTLGKCHRGILLENAAPNEFLNNLAIDTSPLMPYITYFEDELSGDRWYPARQYPIIPYVPPDMQQRRLFLSVFLEVLNAVVGHVRWEVVHIPGAPMANYAPPPARIRQRSHQEMFHRIMSVVVRRNAGNTTLQASEELVETDMNEAAVYLKEELADGRRGSWPRLGTFSANFGRRRVGARVPKREIKFKALKTSEKGVFTQ